MICWGDFVLHCSINKPRGYVEDIDALFNTLTFNAIKSYLNILTKNGISIEKQELIPNAANVTQIYCTGTFGVCNLSNISTSLKILILCEVAIETNKYFSFLCGMLGGNYVAELFMRCKNTDLISMYVPNGRLVYTGVPLDIIKELNSTLC